MKKLLAIAIAVVMVSLIAGSAFAIDAGPLTSSASATVTVVQVFSMEWDPVAFCNDTLAWTDVNPTSDQDTLIRPDGHDPTPPPDTKPDVGIICRTNANLVWGLKMDVSGDLAGKLKYYMDMPYNRNTSAQTNGSLLNPKPLTGEDWPYIPTTATAAYTCDSSGGANADKNNTPLGTGVYLDVALNPIGLVAGSTTGGTITYTMTTTL